MNPERNQKNTTETLTRGQKLRRHLVAPLAAVAALGAIYHGVSQDKNPEQEVGSTMAIAEATATTQFGGGASDWEHGTATRAIQEAVNEAAATALAEAGAPANTNIEEIVSTLPVYDQANLALEMANQDGIVPDTGDKFIVSVEVKADSDKNISYEVVGAEIKDLPNNQQ